MCHFLCFNYPASHFLSFFFFFFNDTATTEIYTLSLHDALPIWILERVASESVSRLLGRVHRVSRIHARRRSALSGLAADRKSTRLNSSHANISYAVFCLKKKKKTQMYT